MCISVGVYERLCVNRERLRVCATTVYEKSQCVNGKSVKLCVSHKCVIIQPETEKTGKKQKNFRGNKKNLKTEKKTVLSVAQHHVGCIHCVWRMQFSYNLVT